MVKRSDRLRLLPAALIALSATLPSATHAAPAQQVSRASTTLRYAYFGGPDTKKLIDKILPQYYKAYPGVTVNLEPEPDSRVKGVTEIAAGTAPDTFMLGDGDVAWYQAKGAVLDLAPYAKKDNFSLSQYYPGTLLLGRLGSHQYSLPKDYSPLAVYYNKDMFKAAGVPLPTEGWTWDQFRQDAIKLTKNGIYGAWLSGSWVREVEPVVRSLGGSLSNADGTKVVGYMNSPTTAKAIQFWVNLFIKDKVSPTPAQQSALNIGDAFASAKTAMTITGIWPYVGATGYAKTLKFNWGVVPLPLGSANAKPINTICYAGFVMSKTTKNPDQTWGLIKYMSGPVGDQVWAGNGLPAIKSVAAMVGADKNPVESVFLKAVDFATLPADANSGPSAQAVGDTLTEGLNLLLNTPGTPVQQVLTIEATKGQKVIQAYFAH
jgi:multiple sugar transport system substrate-binding protein